jgi:hypothetical protein
MEDPDGVRTIGNILTQLELLITLMLTSILLDDRCLDEA